MAWAAGLSVRFRSVTIPTGRGAIFIGTGNTLTAARWAPSRKKTTGETGFPTLTGGSGRAFLRLAPPIRRSSVF